MVLNALVDSFLPQSEKCGNERVNFSVCIATVECVQQSGKGVTLRQHHKRAVAAPAAEPGHALRSRRNSVFVKLCFVLYHHFCHRAAEMLVQSCTG